MQLECLSTAQVERAWGMDDDRDSNPRDLPSATTTAASVQPLLYKLLYLPRAKL